MHPLSIIFHFKKFYFYLTDQNGRGGDYLAVGMQAGHLVFAYNLGSGK